MSYNNLLYRYAKKNIYFVKIPEVAVFTEHDYENSMIPVDHRNGRVEKRDHNRMRDVGLPLYRIAEIANEGHTVRMSDRNSLRKLFKDIEEFLRLYEGSGKMANTGKDEDELYSSIYSFGLTVAKHQEGFLRKGVITIEKMTSSLGLIGIGPKKNYGKYKEIEVKKPMLSIKEMTGEK